ncbi:putative Thioredoxin-like superfamily [Helianthus annuus]|uniref:Thioredoxin-like superfamily n=1 Tax=Helianthus annuus TaxID=4232 RepID=A0A251VD45_HELAN|nr:uncharacterized protein LOC110908567 [Helianthus annuus]KAF5780944.1 putative Thioredoxin-like superfamily [Helianthus annuus]KAJ0508220.1 putative Thioredoxin-like superfamily [Helianthus annuus]KAJ0516516.1 putative Thioredoxin-like superfamily [Helianthus annuus]
MAPGLFACFRKHSATSDINKTEQTSTEELTAEELKRGGPVVVELFSSQGCATSPEAELLFSRLGRGDFNLEVPVVLLAYHVDYWDFNGWKDLFGSSQWTVRQKMYVESLNLDTMFTPQVVVQGRSHCIGNDEDAMLGCIAGAPRYPPPAFHATFQRPTPESLQVTLKGTLRAKLDDQGADVMVALYESGLVTDCKNGDNKGRVIANDFVVRKLSKIWSLKNHPPKKTLTGTIDFGLWDGFNSVKCGIVVFVQQHGTHHIFGSQRIQLPVDL